MTATVFNQKDADFSNKAHIEARQLIYPQLFGAHPERLAFENVSFGASDRETVLDGEMGVDRIVRVTVQQLNAPLVFTVQERFRRPEFAAYRDLTITEWNHASNLPSELYKINAGLFLYGYYDEGERRFLDAIAIGVTDILLAITRGSIHYQRKPNKKQQTFLAFKFSDMDAAGVVRYWQAKSGPSEVISF